MKDVHVGHSGLVRWVMAFGNAYCAECANNGRLVLRIPVRFLVPFGPEVREPPKTVAPVSLFALKIEIVPERDSVLAS